MSRLCTLGKIFRSCSIQMSAVVLFIFIIRIDFLIPHIAQMSLSCLIRQVCILLHHNGEIWSILRKKKRKWAQFKSAAMKKSVYCDLLSRVNVCIYILSVMLILQMLCLSKSLWSILICFWSSLLSCLQTERLWPEDLNSKCMIF